MDYYSPFLGENRQTQSGLSNSPRSQTKKLKNQDVNTDFSGMNLSSFSPLLSLNELSYFCIKSHNNETRITSEFEV